MAYLIQILTVITFLFSALGCSHEGVFRSSDRLEDSPLLTESSKRTVAVMAVGHVPAGSFGVTVDDALNIFGNVSGIHGLRELLGLLAIINPNGTLGAEYKNAALSFGVVDGARVLTLSFLSRANLSTDTLSTINSTARSHGIQVEAIAENESRLTSVTNAEDAVSILMNDQTLSFRHARTGAWPEPNAAGFQQIYAGLRGDGELGSLIAADIGELGRILGAATKLPWTPPSGATFAIGTYLAATGRQTVSGRLHIPGLSKELARCSQLQAKDLIINGESDASDSEIYEVILSPLAACLLGAAHPGYIHLRWKVTSPTYFSLLAPFEERVVSRNVPDTWPGKTPQAEYSKACEGVVVYTGDAPTCARAGEARDLLKVHAPNGFIKRLFGGSLPDAGEFFRLMRLYQDTPADLRANIDGDDIIVEIK